MSGPLEAVRRILVRFPNWLGDTVMALPALRGLREAAPHAEVWGVGPWVPDLLADEPGLHRRLGEPRPWRRAVLGPLREAGFDLALVLPGSWEAAAFAWLAGARWRVGYAGNGRTPFLTHALPPPDRPLHQVEAYLALLAPLGLAARAEPPHLRVADARRAVARARLGEVGIPAGRRAVGIQLGAASGPAKLWPADRIGALIRQLGAHGAPVVMLGTQVATPLLRAVQACLGHTVPHLVGRDDPSLLPALLAELAVLVSPDSGPAHVAAAVGTPVVALFGPTDPRLTAPRGPGAVALRTPVPCAPCFLSRCPIDHRCLRALQVETVAAAVRAHLTSWGR